MILPAVRLISAADFLRKLGIKFARKVFPHDVSEYNETAVFKIINFNYIQGHRKRWTGFETAIT